MQKKNHGWAFALAALYKATKSVFACAVYHAFIDAIGAVYDWNALFDPFPGGIVVNLYRVLILVCSVLLWLCAERRDRLKSCADKAEARHAKGKISNYLKEVTQ